MRGVSADPQTLPLPIHREAVMDPGQVIIDAHHHLYHRPKIRYLLDEMLTDICSGHDVRATVFVQAQSMLRDFGPEELKAIGETEFAHGIAVACKEAPPEVPRICAGIVGHADLTLGDGVRPVLEAHIEAGGDHFKGIRQPLAWDPDPTLSNPAYPSHRELMEDAAFRRGFAHLAPLGLTFDAWLFFHQIPQLTTLARAFPETRIVLNHCGGVLGIGGYRNKREQVHREWLKNLRELARCDNVMVKLGGLGMPLSGFGWERSERTPTSQALADAWTPWFEPCIAAFGASRCMFESNFPADREAYDYAVGWNAMKRVASQATQDEKDALFWRSAAQFYRLPEVYVEQQMEEQDHVRR
ncbi:amidohydrolase [Candidimonas sp. SYP-B2681]|nr:amidohydrolase [Candidimonas sp. SYP-B2681]